MSVQLSISGETYVVSCVYDYAFVNVKNTSEVLREISSSNSLRPALSTVTTMTDRGVKSYLYWRVELTNLHNIKFTADMIKPLDPDSTQIEAARYSKALHRKNYCNSYFNEWYHKSSFDINVLDMVRAGLVLLPVRRQIVYTVHVTHSNSIKGS